MLTRIMALALAVGFGGWGVALAEDIVYDNDYRAGETSYIHGGGGDSSNYSVPYRFPGRYVQEGRDDRSLNFHHSMNARDDRRFPDRHFQEDRDDKSLNFHHSMNARDDTRFPDQHFQESRDDRSLNFHHSMDSHDDR